MKTAEQQFVEEIKGVFAKYYSKQLSESVKRGLRAKKLSTRAKLPCKQL